MAATPGGIFAREVIDTPVADEMSESFLAYSLSVITSRAIPDVRDGFKPVQRRILYSMYRLGLRPDSPHRKSAGVVGDTMGKYHPHGDGAIYDALVRLGWDFARNVTMVDPHGNFGSLDDPPAAYRYTECRPTHAAMDMIGEIVEDTVEFRPTFDGQREEPVYLPGLVPNLLVNGTAGIAVGMATNMAPHNLREVYEAIKLVMTKRRPKVTLDEIMEVLPAPDFPSGGQLIDESLREAYATGRGSVRIRARAEIGQVRPRRKGITITELPYMVGPEKVVAKIKDLVAKDKLPAIAGVNDLSDRKHGLRVVVECKTGADPERLLRDLYRLTPLEETFSFNNVVLVNNRPTTVGIIELCEHYINHRLDVVVRRTEFRLGKARERAHIVEGLLIALDAIDEVIAIIRGSRDTDTARERLMEQLTLTEVQATHILEMQLRRLTALEVQKLIDELAELRNRIDDFEKILNSEKRRRTIVLSELEEVVEAYGRERQSELLDAAAAEAATAELAAPTVSDLDDEPCSITLSTTDMVGRQNPDGPSAKPGRHDVLRSIVAATTLTEVVAITSRGRALRVRCAEVPEVAGRSRGTDVSEIFDVSRGERVVNLATAGTDPLVIVTANGVLKRLKPEELVAGRSGGTVIKLKNDDYVVAAFPAGEDADITMVATDGQTLRTPAAGASVQGRGAAGVGGMKVKAGAHVVGAGVALPDGAIITLSANGKAKATGYDDLPSKGRNGAGVRIMKLPKGDSVTAAYVVGPAPLTAVVASDDDPAKANPKPTPLGLPVTKRDGAGREPDPAVLAVGEARW
jgi:DNA gyrase subunit A